MGSARYQVAHGGREPLSDLGGSVVAVDSELLPELLRSVGTALPPGRMITPDEGTGVEPRLWLSEGPAPAGLWARVLGARAGLWPLLLIPVDGDGDCRPWATGELYPQGMSAPGDHDPYALLARWWQRHTAPDKDDDPSSRAARLAVTAPFGETWPGPAPARADVAGADRTAVEWSDFLASLHPEARLGLVAAECGADTLAALGWQGPVNHEGDTATCAAVVRSWEERFGARVVAIGFDTLHLSVAAPPTSHAEALAVAAEHFAFCPDNIEQGAGPPSLNAYAERLVDTEYWTFWWD